MTHRGVARSDPAEVSIRCAPRPGAVKALAAALMLLAAHAAPMHAQFGALKKLKSKVTSSDSSARAKDSLAQIAAGVAPESVKVERSLLKRSAAVVSQANGALEEKTGISMKDAAIAATGAGAANLVAKKIGGVQSNVAAQALNAATAKSGMGATPGMGAMPGMSAMSGMGAMPHGGAMPGVAGMGGFSQSDAAAILAFQQEMMQVTMAASAGDAGARARLERWQTISLKYQVEAQRLSLAASGGDLSAAQKLQALQMALVREWAATGKINPGKPIR